MCCCISTTAFCCSSISAISIHFAARRVGWRGGGASGAIPFLAAFRRFRIGQLGALAFLPVDAVAATYDLLVPDFPADESPILEYFERVWWVWGGGMGGGQDFG